MKNYEIKLNDGLYHFPELKTKTVDRKRFYITPEGNEYPSITTVLSPRNKKGLMEWRKRVGNDVANHIANKAAVRGTKVHKMCEDWLNKECEDWLNEDFSQETWDKHKKDFFPYTLFNELKNQKFEYITDVYAQEMTLYSDKYKVAGRVDLIANYQHQLSIVDFKTSTNERKDSYNENYYIQTAAYAEMFEEMTGTPINQIVILVVTENGTVQDFVKEKDEYLPLLEKTLEEWYN